MNRIVLEQHGDRMQVTLPVARVNRLGLKAGQEVTVVELPDGISLVQEDAEQDRQMKLVDQVLREQAETLRLLADR